MSKEATEFFNRMGSWSILIGMLGGLIGYFFIPLPFEYGLYVVTELFILGILCFVAARVDLIENVVKRILFGEGKNKDDEYYYIAS